MFSLPARRKRVVDERSLLLRAGWFVGRAINIEADLTALTEAGYPVTDAAITILTEFSGLTISGPNHRQSAFWIDGCEAARESDPGWCNAYAAAEDLTMTPIGGYSHMTVLADEHGRLWGGFDGLYGEIGTSVLQVIGNVLVRPGSRMLDRELPR